MADFPRVVSLACHDLRTPLATVAGFARTLLGPGELDERSKRYLEMIDHASDQLTELLDELGLLSRIEGGRYDPPLVNADTLELARSADERVSVAGRGETIQTDEPAVRRALGALALAALRHGALERVVWTVEGRGLRLEPVAPGTGEILTGDDPRDFGAIVGRRTVEALGGSVQVDGTALIVAL